MKFRISWLLICIIALALFAIGGCKSSDPYDKFKGTWVNSDGKNNFTSFSLDSERKIFTMIRPYTEGKFLFELPIMDMETQEGLLAITINNSLLNLLSQGGWSGIPQFQSLLFEPLDDDSFLLKIYSQAIDPKNLLGKNAPKPMSIVEAKHPDSDQKKILAEIGSSSSQKLWGDWYIEGDDEKPAISFDEKAGIFKLRNAQLIKLLGDSTLTPDGYVEVTKNEDSRQGIMHFKEGSPENGFILALNTSPLEGKLDVESERFTMLPKLSSSEKQQRIEAKQEARRQAAREELEAKRRQEEEARLAQEKAEAEAQRIKEEEEARQKALVEKRVTMPEFSFNDIRLSDSPQQMVEKGLARYKMSTSFPVQQKDNTIGTVKNPSLGAVCFLLEDPLLDEFFGRQMQRLTIGSRYFQLGSESTAGYLMGPSDLAAKAGLRPDTLIFADKTRKDPTSTKMEIAFFTLPGGSPRPLYLEVDGDIVLDAVSVFQDRYGEPESVITSDSGHSTQYIWRSDKEIAILRADRQNDGYYEHHLLYIISLPAYEELTAFEQKLAQQQEAAQKAAEEAKQAEEKARQDARKAGI